MSYQLAAKFATGYVATESHESLTNAVRGYNALAGSVVGAAVYDEDSGDVVVSAGAEGNVPGFNKKTVARVNTAPTTTK